MSRTPYIDGESTSEGLLCSVRGMYLSSQKGYGVFTAGLHRSTAYTLTEPSRGSCQAVDNPAQERCVRVRNVSQLVDPGRQRGRKHAVGAPRTCDDGGAP